MLLVVEPSPVVVLNADGGNIARVGLVCVNCVGVCHNCDVGHMTFIWNFNILIFSWNIFVYQFSVDM